MVAHQPDSGRSASQGPDGPVHRAGPQVRLPRRCSQARARRRAVLDYEAAVNKTEFDFEAPTDYDNNPNTGILGGEIQGRLTMRDVILVNQGSKVDCEGHQSPQSGTYSNLLHAEHLGDRRSGDPWLDGGRRQRDEGQGQEAGEGEVPLRQHATSRRSTTRPSVRASVRSRQPSCSLCRQAPKNTIILGDFNSDVPGVQAGDEQAYQTLLDGGFEERSIDAPTTCCINDLFAPTNTFDHQVDHVMTNMGKKVKLVNSSATGLTPVNGIYDSDHAGVFSTLKISK